MPYLNGRPLARRLACIAIATLSVAAAPAAASACTPNTGGSSQPFTHYGDANWYTFLPGSGFTSSYLPGWTLHNAYVQSAWGQSWLMVNPSGGYAITAPFCVSSVTPNFRFWVRQANPYTWGQMNVAAIWSDAWGNHNVVINGQQLSPNWSLSMSYMLGTMLPTESGGTFMVQLEFTPNAAGGSPAEISGIYVDPYSRG